MDRVPDRMPGDWSITEMEKINSFRLAGYTVGDGSLTLFGGPCTAESLEICRRVAGEIAPFCRELNIQYVFKGSYDKANRTSGDARRGPGLTRGLEILAAIREEFKIPVVTDVHSAAEAEAAGRVVDVVQIPAFLCRQTDILAAAAETGKVVNIKKGQFMAPEDMRKAAEKVTAKGNSKVLLTERGATFGYHNLVVDMRGLAIMRQLGFPVMFDATHSVQLPGGNGNSSGGQREFVGTLARAAAGAGIDALFCEIHPDPDKAWSDGPNSLNPEQAKKIIAEVKAIHDLVAEF